MGGCLGRTTAGARSSPHAHCSDVDVGDGIVHDFDAQDARRLEGSVILIDVHLAYALGIEKRSTGNAPEDRVPV